MNDVLNVVTEVVWTGTIVVGLVMSVVRRHRLGRAAGPAITGFALLLAISAVDVFWEPSSAMPSTFGLSGILAALTPADLAIATAQTVAYPMALALLLIAVLRARIGGSD